jgi:hypothetical protein
LSGPDRRFGVGLRLRLPHTLAVAGFASGIGARGFTVEFMSTSELNGTGSLDAEALVELFGHGMVTGR